MQASPNPRVAVVGCGHWGKNLVRNFADLGALAAVCDTRRDSAAPLAERFSVPLMDWAQILPDQAIAAVAIAAPAEAHFQLVMEALSAGKHVFVEKPLALNLSEAETLCRKAQEAGRVLMVGHLLQYHPAFLKLKEMVGRGDLGRLQYVYSNRLNLGKVRREENILWSFAPHDISMILSLVGEEPQRVEAVGAAYLHKVIADVTTTHFSFPSGVQGHVFVSWLHPFKEQKLVVVGDHGMAVFDDGEPWSSKVAFFPHRIEWIDGVPRPQKAQAVHIPLEEAEPLRQECQHFLDCVEQGKVPRTDGAEALKVLRVLRLAQSSLEASAPEEMPAARPKPDYFVHETAIVDEGCQIGPGSRIWHFSHLLKNTRLGKGCIIGQNVAIGPDVVVGDRCKIQNNVSLYKGVVLEEDVFCGPSCVFTNVNTPRAFIERKDEFLVTRVGRGATIGANATVVCGHTLGPYCLIAAGAVVTRDVLPHALMAGVPARRIGWVSHAGEVLPDDLVCPREGRRYREVAGELQEISGE